MPSGTIVVDVVGTVETMCIFDTVVSKDSVIYVDNDGIAMVEYKEVFSRLTIIEKVTLDILA